MFTTEEKITWLDPKHPNYERWLAGRRLYLQRASAVREIISTETVCTNLSVLDLGSGEGGTSLLFSQHSTTISYDLSLTRLKRQQNSGSSYPLINGNAETLPFADSTFDLIILQDVIEHTIEKNKIVDELKRVLKENGIIYLSTPNKFSFFNIISESALGNSFSIFI